MFYVRLALPQTGGVSEGKEQRVSSGGQSELHELKGSPLSFCWRDRPIWDWKAALLRVGCRTDKLGLPMRPPNSKKIQHEERKRERRARKAERRAARRARSKNANAGLSKA
jgi:hypothetical protein